MLAVLGTSAGLAGIVLVFGGFVIAAIGGFDAATPDESLRQLRNMIVLNGVPFLLGLVCVGVALVWLVMQGQNDVAYVVTLGLFAAQLVATAVAAGYTVYRLVWAD